MTFTKAQEDPQGIGMHSLAIAIVS